MIQHGFRMLALIATALICTQTHAQSQINDKNLRESVQSSLGFMKSVYGSLYAPTQWKGKYAKWDLNTEIEKAMQASKTASKMDVKSAQQILRSFVYSMKDYHVSISFNQTEAASLPFVVQSAKGKTFLAYIDRAKLTKGSFPFNVGDELVTFNGKPVSEELKSVMVEMYANVESTDAALADLTLTRRRASRGLMVPHGTIVLGIKKMGSDEVSEVQLVWEYTAEKVKDPSQESVVVNKNHFMDRQMSVAFDPKDVANPFDIGARKTFTPSLGTKLWESAESDPFHAYMYKAGDGKIIGYIRVPSYVPENADKAVAAFGSTMALFESTTDALVIDQVNNPGGSVFYLYALASMLADKTLLTPQHNMTLSQADILEAQNIIPELEAIKTDEQAQKELGSSVSGYPVSYEFVQFALNYFRFIVAEWEAGRTITKPFYIFGVDRIMPSATHYTKPVLMLVNALDFSGGDFFPAILQDNKRVTVMGTRTAGAGGYVNDVAYPNNLGVTSFRITGSIATRVDGNPIENLGVTPDIEYSMTENDLTHQYSDYVKAIQANVLSLIK